MTDTRKYSGNQSRTAVLRQRRNRRNLMITAAFVGLAVILILIVSLTTHKAMADQTPAQKTYVSVRITEGDTIWTIAEENYTADAENMESYVKEICQINNLTMDDTIHTGANLVVPVYVR